MKLFSVNDGVIVLAKKIVSSSHAGDPVNVQLSTAVSLCVCHEFSRNKTTPVHRTDCQILHRSRT